MLDRWGENVDGARRFDKTIWNHAGTYSVAQTRSSSVYEAIFLRVQSLLDDRRSYGGLCTQFKLSTRLWQRYGKLMDFHVEDALRVYPLYLNLLLIFESVFVFTDILWFKIFATNRWQYVIRYFYSNIGIKHLFEKWNLNDKRNLDISFFSFFLNKWVITEILRFKNW